MPKIILASSSVPRKVLLEKLGISFEIIVSNVDETPIKEFSLTEQMNDISMRKALAVMDMAKETEDHIIVAADQNILFNGIMYGKPSTIEEARKLITKMQGSDEIYSYVGNAVLYVSNSKIQRSINECDISRMRMDYITDEELEKYLSTNIPLTRCAGINIVDAPGIHLEEGKMSTAIGITVEYLLEMMSKI